MTKDIKTTHEYKDLFCVSSLMLSDGKTQWPQSVSQVTKARIKGIPVYTCISYTAHFIRKENVIIGKSYRQTKPTDKPKIPRSLTLVISFTRNQLAHLRQPRGLTVT